MTYANDNVNYTRFAIHVVQTYGTVRVVVRRLTDVHPVLGEDGDEHHVISKGTKTHSTRLSVRDEVGEGV